MTVPIGSQTQLSVSDHVRLLRERSERIDRIANELRVSDNVPAEALTPIHVHAVQLRERARRLEAGEID